MILCKPKVDERFDGNSSITLLRGSTAIRDEILAEMLNKIQTCRLPPTQFRPIKIKCRAYIAAR